MTKKYYNLTILLTLFGFGILFIPQTYAVSNHEIYLSSSSSTTTLIKAIWDNTTSSTSTVDSIPNTSSDRIWSPSIALDSQNREHIVYLRHDAGTTTNIVYKTGTTTEILPRFPWYPFFSSSEVVSISPDSFDIPYVAVAAGQTGGLGFSDVDIWKGGSGNWTYFTSVKSTSSPDFYTMTTRSFKRVLTISGGGTLEDIFHLVYQYYNSTAGTSSLREAIFDGAGSILSDSLISTSSPNMLEEGDLEVDAATNGSVFGYQQGGFPYSVYLTGSLYNNNPVYFQDAISIDTFLSDANNIEFMTSNIVFYQGGNHGSWVDISGPISARLASSSSEYYTGSRGVILPSEDGNFFEAYISYATQTSTSTALVGRWTNDSGSNWYTTMIDNVGSRNLYSPLLVREN